MNDRFSTAKPPPGHWLFNAGIMGWMGQKKLRRQLPWGYRLFAGYARLATALGKTRQIPGGARVFRAVCWLHHAQGRLQRLDLPEVTVWIHLADPRFFNVVKSLMSPPSGNSVGGIQLGRGDTYIDIGANHGEFSLMASRIVGADGLVIAVEAQPVLGEALEKSLRQNQFSPHSVYQTAVGDQAGEIDLHIPVTSSGAAGVFKGYSAAASHYTTKVKIVRFDDLVESLHPPGRVTIKLDIEGSEPRFLHGAEKFIRKHHPRIVIEINPKTVVAAGTKIAEFQSLLIGLGYREFTQLGETSAHPIETLNFESRQDIVLGFRSNAESA